MTLICGIDEAGRGPVIGPLVIAGVLIDPKDEDRLKNIGVKDSKLLSPIQREDMFESVTKIAKKYKIIIIEPGEIDDVVLNSTKKYNLNWLEADKSIEIINTLKPNKAILDCPSTNTAKYAQYFKDKVPKTVEIVAEHKADFTYPVVSAASILAKVTRDAEIEKLKKKYNVQFGSGYPSDPRTQQFLAKYWNEYPFFRKSWDSWQKVKEKKAQKGLMDY